MEPVLAFTIVMAVWTIGEFISSKTKALISMMLVASMIFLIGFSADFFPHDLILDSGLLNLGTAVMGIIIVHLGTMMSLEDLKAQWKTFVVGASTVIIMTIVLLFVGQFFFDRNVSIAGTASITGGTVSLLLVQDKAQEIYNAGLSTGMLSKYLLAVFPLLIMSLKGLVGFLVTSSILKKEAVRVKKEYRKGNLKFYEEEVEVNTSADAKSILPDFLQTPYATLCLLGLTVYIAITISRLTGGYINTFVIALLLGIILRHFKVFKPNALTSTDSFGLLMLSLMVIAFGPLADIQPKDLLDLVWPIIFYLVAGVLIIFVAAYVVGKRVGYSGPLSIAAGMTTFFGFPGTMVLSKEVAAAVGENEKEIAVIEQNILPIMVTAGFSTITITSVITGGLIVGLMMGL